MKDEVSAPGREGLAPPQRKEVGKHGEWLEENSRLLRGGEKATESKDRYDDSPSH